MNESKLRLGVSACLLGRPVRYDGGHKRARFLTDVLGDYVDWVPVCPEMELGLGAPRPPMRLERRDDGVRLVEIESGEDHSAGMLDFSRHRVDELAAMNLRGFVLKSRSPSCGMERVRVYGPSGGPAKEGRGLFAAALLAGLPLLPVEEEGRLEDARLRENFIARIFAYDRWLRFRSNAPDRGGLVRFHAAHKMQILAHSPTWLRALGQLVARVAAMPWDDCLAAYEEGFLRALARTPTPGRHVNVLQHFAGFLKEAPAPDREDLHRVIMEYRRGILPLITPITLLNHHLRRLGHEWVEAQSYLDPYPAELGLRSHV